MATSRFGERFNQLRDASEDYETVREREVVDTLDAAGRSEVLLGIGAGVARSLEEQQTTSRGSPRISRRRRRRDVMAGGGRRVRLFADAEAGRRATRQPHNQVF